MEAIEQAETVKQGGAGKSGGPPAVPTAVPVVREGGTAEIGFGPRSQPITETLERTVDMLTRERARNERLQERIAELEDELAAKNRETRELNDKLTGADSEVRQLEQSLEKWKADVLGFRDEMRQAEEAEMQALQEIIALLRKFAKEETTQ